MLTRPKAFGGEKHRVADVLSGGDDMKRKSLLNPSDQHALLPEIINRGDDNTRRVAELTIHDMRSLFRAIDPSLENIVQLIQHWLVWDLADASDLHHFDEQVRRLETLHGIELVEDIKARYRPALGKRADEPVRDEEILQLELKRLEVVAARFISRRAEDEAFQMIIRRSEEPEAEPVDYKRQQAVDLRNRFEAEKQKVEDRAKQPAAAPEPDPAPEPQQHEEAAAVPVEDERSASAVSGTPTRDETPTPDTIKLDEM